MKTKILSLVVAMSMLLSLCGFSVNAEESLTLKNYNIMTNAINLEFSADVDSVTATVGNIAVTGAEKVGDNAKLWTIMLAERMDITKTYILDFTATPTDNSITALTAKKAISFEVLRNDDFTDRTQFADINAVKEKYTIRGSSNNISGEAETIWANKTLTTNGLSMAQAPAALVPVGFEMEHTHGRYFTTEADFVDFSAVGAKAIIWFDNYFFGNGTPNSDMWVSQNQAKSRGKVNGWLEETYNLDQTYDSVSLAISVLPNDGTAANEKSADINIAVNGKTYVNKPITMQFSKRFIGLNATDGSYNLKALRIFNATMEEVSEFGISGYEITSKFIKVNLTGEPATTPNVSVVSLGDTLAVNTTVSGNTIVIKPANGSFPLDREILVSIPVIEDSYGQTVNVDKKFKLASLLTEDFESYTSLEQMTKYSVAFDIGKQRISMPEAAASDEYKDLFAINIEECGNHRLQFNTKPSNCHAYFTFFQEYPKRHDWKDYILEFDVDTDIRDSKNQKQYAMTIIQTASGYNDGTGALYDGYCKNVMRFEGDHKVNLQYSVIGFYRFGPNSESKWYWHTKSTPQGDVSFIIGPQNDKTIAYLNNEVLYSDTYTLGSSSEGEFAFASNISTEGAKQYIDNIKAYKVVDLAASEVYVKTAAKANNTVSGKLYVTNRDNTVTGATKAIAAVYDSNYRLIGAQVLDVTAEQAAGSERDYSVAIPETTEGAVTVRAFWWSGLDTMSPQANSASKTIN